MSADAHWELNFEAEELKRQLRRQITLGVEDVFKNDIKLEAKRLSPVLTGNNRESIDTEVTETDFGCTAELFTQSGYGGYLETGTRKMKAQPYLWPALNRFLKTLQDVIGTKIATYRKAGGR